MQGVEFSQFYNEQKHNLLWGKSTIQFRYVVGHKPEAGKSKRREILYVNETTKLPFNAVEGYIDRTDEEVYLDCNPDMEHWLHTEIMPLDDCETLTTTYLDNEQLKKGERKRIETKVAQSKLPGASNQLKNWVNIYAYGITGTYSDRRIYEFEIREIPDTAKRVASGMDFGKSPAATTLVDLYLDGPDLYAKLVFKENNLLPFKIKGAEHPAICDRLETVGHPKGWLIIADSAGRTEIIDLRKHGYNVRGVKKIGGSLSQDRGIQLVRSFNLFFTPESKELIKAAESWFWKVDSNSKIIPVPDGHEPDELVAIRYPVMGKKLW